MHAFEAPFEAKLQFAGVDASTLNEYRIAAREAAQRRIHSLAHQAGMNSGQVAFRVLHGDTTRSILMLEQELDCELIIMGKHVLGVLEELLLGSVTKHILSESACDVLVASRAA